MRAQAWEGRGRRGRDVLHASSSINLLPYPVPAKRHEVVHAIVRVGDAVENAGDAPLLLRLGDRLVAEMRRLGVGGIRGRSVRGVRMWRSVFAKLRRHGERSSSAPHPVEVPWQGPQPGYCRTERTRGSHCEVIEGAASLFDYRLGRGGGTGDTEKVYAGRSQRGPYNPEPNVVAGKLVINQLRCARRREFLVELIC